ncbi:hypothetical protein [Massilia glaciei]|uniref:Uncharacterized protein n=1 Tax=Massilia glaciei TaxID=1524097 RepID=A0A2U2HN43_9BURK|nr:hypothetical protein [Massilia glaciei]PWF48835.1 hypothetical protein C7C56_009745 [Massilia glaciei]
MNDLQRIFPGVEFKCIDTPKRIDSFKNCTKVVSMVKWIFHTADKITKKAACDRYVHVEDSQSDLKRVIALWLASGTFKAA